MEGSTAALWATQDRHKGDRHRLFRTVRDAITAHDVLYPGSYVDVAASFVWPAVTYVDVDKRAARFFGDTDGVRQIIADNSGKPDAPELRFLSADYSSALPLPHESFDLLISLYAGFVSRSCTPYLRIGGWLLVNPSHGDAALASLDDRYELHAAVDSTSDSYAVRTHDLETYLIPKKPEQLSVAAIERSGRGVAYTRSAFAYLFRRVS